MKKCSDGTTDINWKLTHAVQILSIKWQFTEFFNGFTFGQNEDKDVLRLNDLKVVRKL